MGSWPVMYAVNPGKFLANWPSVGGREAILWQEKQWSYTRVPYFEGPVPDIL